jgi:class 3 adenylate cyclase
MSNLEKNKIHSTSVITDLRNFSKTFKDFQNKNSEDFLQFIEEYYSTLNSLATILSDKIWIDSIGDGILAIFLDEETHHKSGYAYILASHRAIHSLCSKFISEHKDSHISFGIGADSGNVWKVGEGYLNTYVGTVINRAARIETTTKSFEKSTTAIGNSLYKSLLKDFYPSAYTLVDETDDYDALLNKNPETVLISKQFMLQYAYDMPLKGIQSNAPIFRLSDSLAKEDDMYWSVMANLVGGEKSEKVKQIIK